MQIFINGFGRIGRTVLRAALQGAAPGVTIAGINDIAPAQICAYLFEYDSVFGPWRGTVGLTDHALVVDGQAIPLHLDVADQTAWIAALRRFVAHAGGLAGNATLGYRLADGRAVRKGPGRPGICLRIGR